MDAALRTLADAGLALDAAEEALEAGEASTAEARLDEAGDALEVLREQWPDLPKPARAVVGPAGKDVRERRDALLRRLPKRRALSEASAAEQVADPEDEVEPDA